MNSTIIESLKKRRTQYALGRNVALDKDTLTALVKEAIKHTPSSFNSQSSRAVILFGEQSEQFWELTKQELKKIVLEGVEEHHQAKMFLRELSNLVEDSEKFQPKLKVLMEDIAHHVQEEEGQMFPMIEEQFDEYTLQMLGDEMDKEKKAFKKSHKAAGGQ